MRSYSRFRLKREGSKTVLPISENRFRVFSNLLKQRVACLLHFKEVLNNHSKFFDWRKINTSPIGIFSGSCIYADAPEHDVFIISHWLVNADDLHSQLHLVRPLVVRVPMYC